MIPPMSHTHPGSFAEEGASGPCRGQEHAPSRPPSLQAGWARLALTSEDLVGVGGAEVQGEDPRNAGTVQPLCRAAPNPVTTVSGQATKPCSAPTPILSPGKQQRLLVYHTRLSAWMQNHPGKALLGKQETGRHRSPNKSAAKGRNGAGGQGQLSTHCSPCWPAPAQDSRGALRLPLTTWDATCRYLLSSSGFTSSSGTVFPL